MVDGDVAENMNRLYYRGLAGYDPDDDEALLSLLIWELKSVEDNKDTESELKWIYAIDPSYIPELLEGYRDEALNEDVKRTFFESSSIDKAKEAALDECGFSPAHTESKDIEVTLDECKRMSIAKKQAPPYVQSVISLGNQAFYQGLMNILFKYENPALEDLSYLPKGWYEQTISCYTKTDGKVTGFLLIHATPSGVLVPVLFFAVGADSRINLIEMLRFSINRAAKVYPGNTIVRIHRRNPEVKALTAKLFPDKKGSPAIAGERSEAF
ncbi:MAG: hypothetical protein K6A76_07200 [Oribacterium sp.]|nr:hypothetical protein [Oribacterium sp.]